MKPGIALILIACLLFAPGCPMNWTPEAKLLAARESFSGAVNTVAAIREQGGFTPETAATVSLLIEVGQKSLDRWEASIELGEPVDRWSLQVNDIVRELTAERIAAERRLKDGDS